MEGWTHRHFVTEHRFTKVILGLYICSAQCTNQDNSGIVLGKVGILILSSDSSIVLDNFGIEQSIYVAI